MGREPGPGQDPAPPLEDRHGIPNLGTCIRCNFQIEGSGVSADDVVIDAGDVNVRQPAARSEAVKDVGIRADRADGFVLRNMTVRHADEHDIYVLESDGYLLDRFKTFYAGEYGVLTFVEDHGADAELRGRRQRRLGPLPRRRRREWRRSANAGEPSSATPSASRTATPTTTPAATPGTDGNATHVDHNNFYDNALGFTTDVFTAAGHPGFPQDSDLVENNNFYSNNFNPYVAGSDVEPSVPVPVGTGLWIAGGNDNIVRNNHFYDNWRRGTMLFAVPDAIVCGPTGQPDQAGCDPTQGLDVVPQPVLREHHGRRARRQATQPNGTDFWWDSYPENTGNCWYDNTARTGRRPASHPTRTRSRPTVPRASALGPSGRK